MDKGEVLVRVSSPHFVAGLVEKGGVVVEAAPILRWTLGKTKNDLKAYFNRKGWTAQRVRSDG